MLQQMLGRHQNCPGLKPDIGHRANRPVDERHQVTIFVEYLLRFEETPPARSDALVSLCGEMDVETGPVLSVQDACPAKIKFH